jgi:hypothetical protein
MKKIAVRQFIICAGLWAFYCGKLAAQRPQAADLSGAILISRLGQRDALIQFVVTSNSSEFICLDFNELDPMAGGVHVDAIAGGIKRRPLGVERDRLMDLDFDLADSYLFIRPHEKRLLTLNSSELNPTPGEFKYWISIPYYKCADIISKARYRRHQDIKTYALRSEGTFHFP